MLSIDSSQRELLETKQEFIVYKYRFLIILVYIISTNQSILMLTVFTPLQSTLETIYDESITIINFGTLLISALVFVPAIIISNFILDTYGLRIGFIVGSSLNLIGGWIRCFSKHDFAWIFVGQCLTGFSLPYFITTAQKVSSIWFAPSERVLATTFMLSGDLIADSVGRLIPQWFIDINADAITMSNQLQRMLLCTAILSSVSFVFTVLLMRDKPPTPPSKAAAAKKYGVKSSLKIIVKDVNTIMMLISTAMVGSIGNSYGAILQQLVQPLGINGNQVGDILAISTFMGPPGSLIAAAIVYKSKKYKTVILAASLLALIFFLLNLFAAESGNIYFFGITAGIFCLLMAPVLPCSLELGMELAFPVGEATLGGVWYAISTPLSTIESIIADVIIEKSPNQGGTRTAFLIMAGFLALGIIPLFLVKENLKRSKYEQKQTKELNEEISIN